MDLRKGERLAQHQSFVRIVSRASTSIPSTAEMLEYRAVPSVRFLEIG